MMPWFYTVRSLRAYSLENGSHWFSAGAIRFFNSRFGRRVYGGRYFVSSERFDHKSPRRYTVRMVRPGGDVQTVGAFQGFGSSRAAVRYIRAILADESENREGAAS